MSNRKSACYSISPCVVGTATGAWTAGVGSLQILNRQEAATLLTVGVSTIRKWQREGRLPTTKLGTRVGVRAIDVEQFIRENTTVSSHLVIPRKSAYESARGEHRGARRPARPPKELRNETV
jgi:excisionase family DNA binding protein